MTAVEADLLAQTPGLRVQIVGRGNVLTCRLDGDGGKLWSLVRGVPRLVPLLRRVAPILVRLGLRLDITVGRTRIARLGSGVSANLPARLLALDAARIGG